MPPTNRRRETAIRPPLGNPIRARPFYRRDTNAARQGFPHGAFSSTVRLTSLSRRSRMARFNGRGVPGPREREGRDEMTKATLALACVLSIGLMSALPAGGDTIAKFKGGIGVIPVSNVVQNANGTVTVAPNSVRGVTPPGQIWVIARLEADVRM